MQKKQQIVVIGLGVFGETIARELTRLGHDVLGIDNNEQVVDRLSECITHAVIADVTDEQAIEELSIADYDVAVLAIGRNFEATILATMHLQNIGLRKIWAKALTTQHQKILQRLGVHRVIAPEYEMGVRIAQELNYPNVLNYIGLGDGDYVVEIEGGEALDGHTMEDILEKTGANITALVIKRSTSVHHAPGHAFQIKKGDHLVLGGQLEEFRKIESYL
ncbi:Ktr system potassium uptake protein [Marinobacter santoriniensis NKSG1]|uniref:Ktr system potassium uptake protein n=1 Tax=Marinobacter santoriniensis NKSG1 TaxID=1288826 RepID=M7DAA4_9GAMM|nr:TrkA family potassium uptake protein [Marinobacter santoriniensis]EMP54587.1 Ktr system potassium uptake protein [Marinobacter santoriniensis NKSG1]